jgi:hypothetical protein
MQMIVFISFVKDKIHISKQATSCPGSPNQQPPVQRYMCYSNCTYYFKVEYKDLYNHGIICIELAQIKPSKFFIMLTLLKWLKIFYKLCML